MPSTQLSQRLPNSNVPAGFSINDVTGMITSASTVNAGATGANYNLVISRQRFSQQQRIGQCHHHDRIRRHHPHSGDSAARQGCSQLFGHLGCVRRIGRLHLAAHGGRPSLAVAGLTFNTATGVVSGASPVLGTATLTVTDTDSQSHFSASVTFTWHRPEVKSG